MGDTSVKKLHEIKRKYMLRVLVEADWDYKKASSVLKVSERFLRKQIRRFHPKPCPNK